MTGQKNSRKLVCTWLDYLGKLERLKFSKNDCTVPGRGVLERVSAVGFCQEMAVVAAISQVKDCYKILKHIILPIDSTMAFVAAISQVKNRYKILKYIILPMYTN
jgi:hypothetical protein